MKKDSWLQWMKIKVQGTIRSLCKGILLLATLVGLLLILLDLGQFFFQSSDFTVKRIDIEGNVNVSQDEIQSRLSIAPGTNLWMVDLEALRARLEEHPAIRNVAVLRIPPNRLQIAIDERTPLVFSLNPDDGRFYGMDRDGVVYRRLNGPEGMETTQEAYRDLLAYPVLSGDFTMPYELGKQMEDRRALETLDFLYRLQTESPLAFSELVEVEIKKEGNVMLHPRRRIGVFVLRELNSPQLEKKIVALWKAMEEHDLRAIYVDARFPDQGFAVRWDEGIGDRWKELYHAEDANLISAG